MFISMEFVVPCNNFSTNQVVRILEVLGAKKLGGFAEKGTQFGNGAKYLGSAIQIGDSKFTLIWEEKNKKISMQPIVWKENYVLTSEMPISVYGIPSGDKAYFASKEDAAAWLKNLSSIERLKLSVKAPDYDGPAVMYLS